MLRVVVLCALLVAAGVASVQAQTQKIQTKVINVPDNLKGTAAKVEVHLVTDTARAPNAPPKPSAPAVACGRPCQTNANQCCDGSDASSSSGSAGVSAPGKVDPATQVVTPAAQLQTPTQPLTNDAGQNNEPTRMPLTTSTAVKVVPNLDQQCGCPPNSADPCDNPCAKPTRGLNDELESRLIDVKNEIVTYSQKLKNDRLWVKQVQDIIKHYDTKIKAVQGDENVLKDNIRKLFDKKDHYEKLLLQYRVDKDHFNKLVGGEKAPAIPTITPPVTTTTEHTLEFKKEVII